MQKVWKQIGFSQGGIEFLLDFIETNHLKNESEAINELIKAHKRFQVIISNLERAAWKGTNSENKKELACEKFRIDIDDQKILDEKEEIKSKGN